MVGHCRRHGILYRADVANRNFGGDGYFAVFENGTSVSLFRRTTRLAHATLPDVLQRMQPRTLRVVSVGHFHRVLVDGVERLSLVDDTFTSGVLGVVGSYEIVNVDRFALRRPEQRAPRVFPIVKPSLQIEHARAPHGELPFFAYSVGAANHEAAFKAGFNVLHTYGNRQNQIEHSRLAAEQGLLGDFINQHYFLFRLIIVYVV